MPVWAITTGIVSIAAAIGVVYVSWTVEDIVEITDKPAGNALLWGGALLVISFALMNIKKVTK